MRRPTFADLTQSQQRVLARIYVAMRDRAHAEFHLKLSDGGIRSYSEGVSVQPVDLEDPDTEVLAALRALG